LISKNFIKSSFIYTLSGALPLASGIILLPLYGEYISPEIMGALSIYFSFAMLVQILVAYSFDASLYVYYHEYKKDPDKLAAYVSSAFVLILFISGGVGLLMSLLGNWLFAKMFAEQSILFYPFGLISIVTGIFQALQKVNSSLLQTQQKPTLFFWFNLLSFSLIASFTVMGLIFFPGTLWGPVGGKLIATLISAAWVLVYIFKEFGIHFNWPLLKTTISFNNSSYIYQLQQWAINYFDRPLILLILPLFPLASLGVYDLALKCLVAIDFIMVGLNASFTPKVLSIYAEQKQKETTIETNRYYHGLTAISMLLVSLSILVFPWIIEFFFKKPGYQQAIPLIPYVAIIYLFRCMRLYVAIPYSALKCTTPLPVFYLVVLLAKISFIYLLIGRYGIYGVIISTWLSYILEIIILYIGIRKKFTFRINFTKIILAPILLTVLILVLEPWLGKLYSHWLHGFYVLMTVGMLGWAFRNEIKTLVPNKINRYSDV
jgi:O-antigen/teichoic acid export membrane protein